VPLLPLAPVSIWCVCPAYRPCSDIFRPVNHRVWFFHFRDVLARPSTAGRSVHTDGLASFQCLNKTPALSRSVRLNRVEREPSFWAICSPLPIKVPSASYVSLILSNFGCGLQISLTSGSLCNGSVIGLTCIACLATTASERALRGGGRRRSPGFCTSSASD
jgi:hypothetical protein